MRPKTRLFIFLGLFHFSFAGNEGKVAPSLYFSEAPPLSTLYLFSCLCSSKVRVPSTNTSRRATMGHVSHLFFTANQIHWRIRLSEKHKPPPQPPHPLSHPQQLPSVGVATRTFTVRSRQFCRAPHPSLQIS